MTLRLCLLQCKQIALAANNNWEWMHSKKGHCISFLIFASPATRVCLSKGKKGLVDTVSLA